MDDWLRQWPPEQSPTLWLPDALNMMPARLTRAAALTPSHSRAALRYGSVGCVTGLQDSRLFSWFYKHTPPTLNPTVIVELTSIAKSLKTTVNSVWLLCPYFDTIISSSSPAESVARTSRAVLTELLIQTAWLSSADVHSSQLTF